MDKLKYWILHPFLFAMYPVLTLLASNIEQVPLLYSLRSIIFSFALTILILAITRMVLKDWRKAALVTSMAILFFFTYGLVFNAIRPVLIFGVKIARHRYLFSLICILLIGFGWLCSRKLNISIWTQVMNLIGFIALLLPIVRIAWYEANNSNAISKPLEYKNTAVSLGLSVLANETPPDIYLIILDTYTRHDSMMVNFGYDNSEFVESLTQMGFYVADCSQSNYSSTYSSLASLLNFDYLPVLNEDFTRTDASVEQLYPYLNENEVRKILTDLGYTFVAFDSGYSPTDFQDADYYFSAQSDPMGAFLISGLNPFEVILMQNSAGVTLYDYSVNKPQLKIFFDAPYILYRNRIVYAMDNLPRITSLPSPKFVFVHLLAPHNPFVFGSDGEEIIPQFPFSLDDDRNVAYPEDYAAGYTAEVTYINKRFLEIIDLILQSSETPPIIILQGDHGIPRIDGWHMPILNAYYLPGENDVVLYPSISPVNSFRIIFNQFFNGSFDILDDKVCDTTVENPFDCVLTVDPDPMCR